MSQPQKRFSIFRFLVSASLQFGLLLLAIRLVAPGFWASQAATGAGAFLLVCLAGNLFLTFFEWGFHRYLLHQVVIGRLSRLAATHRNHHSLTPIRLERVKGSPNRVVLNRYPIVEEEQFEDSAFPFYALLVFWLIFSPLLIVAQCLIPGAPVVMGGLTAITWSTVSYEVLHAVGHWPYDRWEHMTEHPTFGPVWKKLYGFHHYHHANTGRNMAISGFILGFPLADFVLGTYHQPRELLLEGRTATALDFAAPALPRFVQRLDGWARKRESNVGRREARTDTPAA
jgi:hemolysin III